MMYICNLCPRKCGIDRDEKLGLCRMKNELAVSKASVHVFEEPVISGTRGSGTIFFAGCNLSCVFCQNYEISQNRDAIFKYISKERLVEIFFELKAKGVHNINLVSPMHFSHLIKDAIIMAKDKGFDLPFVYNTNSYELKEAIKNLDGLIDIYLADFKYFSDSYANEFSHAPHYREYALEAIDEMLRQVPEVIVEDGIMKKGVIIRLLLLPNLYFDAKKIVRLLYGKYGDSVIFSLMNQYQPMHKAKDYKKINRTVSDLEYDSFIDYAADLGISKAFVQDKQDGKNYTPSFDLEGV